MVLALLILPAVGRAQSPSQSEQTGSATQSKPLTDYERAELMRLIQELQERVSKLEARACPTPAPEAQAAPAGVVSETMVDGVTVREPPSKPVDSAKNLVPAVEKKGWGRYTPNLGFKLADTEHGDVSLSIYTYARYLNQLALNSTYTDAFGNVKNIQRRQDVQIQKLQFKFLGWMVDPRLRYFLYAWTSNATQGQGAQVVLAGNLSFKFSDHFTFAGGIRSLPGTRSVEGNFPFWLGVDSRMITDEFMRPSYTSGIWATGDITDRLKYQVMLGNNLSTLGVSASRIDNGLNTFSSALIWFPTGTFEEGFSGQGWGDFENHQDFSTRLGLHLNRSDENKESQPGNDTFENTQIRLSDGTIIFTPDLFGPGVTVSDVRWRMASLDGAFKYRGYSLEGEYYLRWLDNYRGTNIAGVPNLFDHGFQLQGSAMVVPRELQAYAGHSRIFGEYGDPWDVRLGTNWFPFNDHVVRWNTEALYLYKSPVGYSSVPFVLGGKGWVFHSTVEMAF